MELKIGTFAALKDYFSNSLIVEIPENCSIAELEEQLIHFRPEAKDILAVSRFAVGETLVERDFKLTANDEVFVLPPSSGG